MLTGVVILSQVFCTYSREMLLLTSGNLPTISNNDAACAPLTQCAEFDETAPPPIVDVIVNRRELSPLEKLVKSRQYNPKRREN